MSSNALDGYVYLLMLGAFGAALWAAYTVDPIVKRWPRWQRWPANFVLTLIVLLAPAIVWSTTNYLRGR